MACKDNLCKRKCAHNPLCPICELEHESIEHVLFRCPWTEAICFGCGLSFLIKEHPIASGDRWAEELLCGNLAKESSPEVVGYIFQICWAIWKAKNECVFNGVLPNLERTVDIAKRANSDYLHATFGDKKQTSTKLSRERKWSPPSPSFLKFNCD